MKVDEAASIDPRSNGNKPVADSSEPQSLISKMFAWYWHDREYARTLFPLLETEVEWKVETPFEFTKFNATSSPSSIIIEEGAVGYRLSKLRKRSATLLEEGRDYFKSREPDGRLHCKVCGFAKPHSVDQEIVQLHHKNPISDIEHQGRILDLADAIKLLVPLCPTCHSLAHTAKPPLDIESIQALLECSANGVLKSRIVSIGRV